MNKLIQDLGAGAFALTDLLEHQPIGGPPSLKGDINALVTLLNTIYAPITGGAYVLKAGDTMTGLLQFSGTGHFGLRLNNLTTAQRDAIGVGSAGMAIWNTTSSRFDMNIGGSWKNFVRLDGDTMTGKLIITQATANTAILTSTGYSLTGADATNMIDLAGTWNTSGSPTLLKVNVTNTASGASPLLFDFQVGSVSKFNLSKATMLSMVDAGSSIMLAASTANNRVVIGNGNLKMYSGYVIAWSNGADAGNTLDIGCARNAAGVLEINNGVVGTFRDLKLRALTMDTAGLLSITSGANQRAGNLTLVGGTLTVANTTVTANSIILLTRKTAGGTIGFAVTYTLIAATSFTVSSDNVLDTSTYSYLIIEVP